MDKKEMLEGKNAIKEMKNASDGFLIDQTRLTEEYVNLRIMSIETSKTEQKREKRCKSGTDY